MGIASENPKKELSGLQAAIMRVLWERRTATVAEVQAELEKERPLAHNTVATVLTRLAREGIVAAEKEGRSYVYRPVLEPQQARRSMVAAVVRRLFGGRPAALVSHLVRESELDEDDLQELEELIKARKTSLGNSGDDVPDDTGKHKR
jgi:predicted transcriptional regulator